MLLHKNLPDNRKFCDKKRVSFLLLVLLQESIFEMDQMEASAQKFTRYKEK